MFSSEHPTYYWKAILNYIREELLATSEFNEGLIEELDKIKEGPNDVEIKALKNDIIKLNEQKRFLNGSVHNIV